MLMQSKLVAFAATSNPDRAKAFYRDSLGLTLLEDTPFALVFDANGTTLRIQKVQAVQAQGYTSLGWAVVDINAVLQALVGRGVVFERFAGLPQDDAGVWRAPSGAQVAWFKDPDGNLLSITE